MLTISIHIVYGTKGIEFQNALLIYEHITIPIIQVRKKLRAKKRNLLQSILIEKRKKKSNNSPCRSSQFFVPNT